MMTLYYDLNQILVQQTTSAEELNSTPGVTLKLVLALRRALPAEVQARSSLAEELVVLPATNQLLALTLSTRKLSTQRWAVPRLRSRLQSIC